MRRFIRGCLSVLVAVVVVVFLSAMLVVLVASFARVPSAQQSVTPVTPQTLALAKGTVTVPGAAYIDDLDAASNTRAGTVNIWQSAGVNRGQRVCALTDGYEIQLVATQDVDGITWFRIQAEFPEGLCDGWVREEWISSQ